MKPHAKLRRNNKTLRKFLLVQTLSKYQHHFGTSREGQVKLLRITRMGVKIQLIGFFFAFLAMI